MNAGAGNDAALWREADAALDRLLDLPVHQRDSALRALDLTPAVRLRVERLLEAHASTGGVLERPLRGGPAPDALAGRRLGDWTLEREIGRGGMAVVYRAHRDDGPQRRSAAVKLLTLGALAGMGPARLHNEHAMLARLNHPHIVPLFDAGVADDGTPWLAMALVDGVHVDAWCRGKALDTRAIVRLFLDVCDAVGYAHQNLVIHRDLKPSNVLVDAHGHVRLLDFGISRLAGVDAEATATLHRALTPSYASPEQFTGAAPATTMDVYGLGALLHRLLVGASPQRDADAPAARASRTAAAQGASKQRVRELREDLDAILAKALHLDAAQRYASAGALAADLRRWLDGRPVLAAPPAAGYRMRKFVVRHRLGVGASVAVLLALAAGIGGTLWQARVARLQAAQATAIKDFVLELFAATNPDVAQGADPPASLLLRGGAQRVRSEFGARPAVLGEMLGVIGRVQLERGLLEDAEVSLDDAIAAYARLPRVLSGHAVALGDRAMVAYERGNAVDALRRLRTADQFAADAGLDPNDTRRIYLQVRVAEMQVETDQAALAESSARVALARIAAAGASDTLIHPDALCALATALHHQSRAEEALPVLLEAEALQRRIAPVHPKMAVILNDLGILQNRLGRREEADATMVRAVERHEAIYGPLHPQTVRTRANRASLLRSLRGPAASAREYERVLPAARVAFGPSGHAQLVNILGQLAVSLDEAGEGDKAMQAAREAWAMQSALPIEQRGPNTWVAGVLGVMLFERGDAAAAELISSYDPPTCDALEQRTAFSQRLCIVRALLEADAGRCVVPPAQPPAAAAREGPARDWWAAWWWLRARCETGDDEAERELAARTERGDLPAWLAMRMAAQPAVD